MRIGVPTLLVVLVCPGPVAAKCAGSGLASFFDMAADSTGVAAVTVEAVDPGTWKLRINEVLKGPMKVGEFLEVAWPTCEHKPGRSEIVLGSRWVMTLKMRMRDGSPRWSAPICGVFAAKLLNEMVEIPSEFDGNAPPTRISRNDLRKRIAPRK